MKYLEVNKMSKLITKPDKIMIKRQLILFVALIISAILYNLLILPLNLVVNGTSGIATITNYIYGIDPALMHFLLYGL